LPIPQLKSNGIELHERKSGYVKVGGKWLKPLKFLGMEYDGNLDQFRAKTRNGATLILDEPRKDILRFEHWLKTNLPNSQLGGSAKGMVTKLSLEDNLNNHAKWSDLLNARFSGLMFSRMQMDDWNVSISQDFSLDGKAHPDSWLTSMMISRMSLSGWTSYIKHRQAEGGLRAVVVKLPEVGRVKLNTFNCSSFAINDLARRLGKK
jgi:hypothetical protein